MSPPVPTADEPSTASSSPAPRRQRVLRSVRRATSLGLLLLALVVALAPSVRAAPRWGWPLAAPHPVTRPFTPGPHPWSPGHRGVDLSAPVGAQVLAAGAGRVSFAGPLAGRGVVVVDHGDLRTTYEPVAPSVTVGTPVLPGAPLGRLEPGHAGCPAAACLHWGLLRGDDYLDPLRLVEAGPVRLLPLGRTPAGDSRSGDGPVLAAPSRAGPGSTAPTAARADGPAARRPRAVHRALAGGSAGAVLATAGVALRRRSRPAPAGGRRPRQGRRASPP